MISRRHGLSVRDIGHHGWESGNVDTDKVTVRNCVIGRGAKSRLGIVKTRGWRLLVFSAVRTTAVA